MLNCPLKILIGPLRGLKDEAYTMSLTSEIGDYIHSSNIKAFSQVPGDRKGLSLNYTLTHFDHILAQLPSNWTPDVVIWWDMTLHAIPPGIENCPYPTIGVAGDWYMNIDNLVQYARAFDHILGDSHIIKILKSKGVEHCSYWPCFGFDHHLFYRERSKTLYDISFIGHLNARIHQKRNQLLQQIARLGETYRVFIGGGIYGESCRKIFNQSRIVFNYGGVGQVMNKRAYEAPACGALLFMEEDNQEIESILPAKQACILYNEDNLIDQLNFYLENEELRSQIAEEGYQRIQAHSYQNKFARLLDQLPTLLSTITTPRTFSTQPIEEQLFTVAKQLYYPVTSGSSDRAIAHLQPYFNEPENRPYPHLLNIWAVLILQASQKHEVLQIVETLLSSALKIQSHPILLLNMGLLFQKQGRSDKALEFYQKSLQSLENHEGEVADFDNLLLYFYNSTDWEAQEALNLIIRWERAYFIHLNSPKNQKKAYSQLLLWYNWSQISHLHREQEHLEEACKALEQAILNCPSIPAALLNSAQLYLQLNQPLKAIEAYHKALKLNPFQTETLLKLCHLLEQHNQWTTLQKLLKQDWHLWHQSLVFNSIKDQLIAYYQLAEMMTLEQHNQRISYLKDTFNKDLVTLLQKQVSHFPAMAAMTKPIELTLKLSPLEKLPIISDYFTLNGHGKTLTIGEKLIPAPPLLFQRVWDRNSQLEQGVLGPDLLPYLFLTELPNLSISLDSWEENNILLLINNYQDPSLKPMLNHVFRLFGTTYKYWLWSPFNSPEATDLDKLETQLPEVLLNQLEILIEDFSAPEQAALIQQFDFIGGNVNFHLWWALYLNKPTLFFQDIFNPYQIEKNLLTPLVYPIKSLEQIKNNSGLIHEFIQGYQANQLIPALEQLFWNLKLATL